MRVAESSADLKCRNVRTDVIALAHRSRKLQIQLRCTPMVDLNVVQSVVRLVEGLAEAGWSPLRTKIIRRASRIELASAGADRSEEHTSELQSRFGISYAVFCLKKKK